MVWPVEVKASPMWTDMVLGADTKVSVCGYGYDKEKLSPRPSA
jgi:hypothetical protein